MSFQILFQGGEGGFDLLERTLQGKGVKLNLCRRSRLHSDQVKPLGLSSFAKINLDQGTRVVGRNGSRELLRTMNVSQGNVLGTAG